ncbi:MAG: hypothetical protein IIZ94_11920 [Prevotella sp.]|nr:hypothetical protein [Prevotella sp.]
MKINWNGFGFKAIMGFIDAFGDTSHRMTDRITEFNRKCNATLDQFCSVCFWGKPVGEWLGDPLCQERKDHIVEIVTDDDCCMPHYRKRDDADFWIAYRRRQVNASLYELLTRNFELQEKLHATQCGPGSTTA